MHSSRETFQSELIDTRLVFDPLGKHHVLSSGVHARKLNMDAIIERSGLFRLWVDAVAEVIADNYEPDLLDTAVLISVANGTNRIVRPVAEKLGGGVVGLLTKKTEQDKVVLAPETKTYLRSHKPRLALVFEDVGTTGNTALGVVIDALAEGAQTADVVVSVQRREQLGALLGAGVTYFAAVTIPTEDYTPEECAKVGFCSQNWKLYDKYDRLIPRA